MADGVLKVLLVADATAPWAGEGIDVQAGSSLLPHQGHDALVFDAPDAAALDALLQRCDFRQLCTDLAVVVIAPTATLAERLALLRLGVQDVVEVTDPPVVRRALWHGVERKRLDLGSRPTYATDLATGLPHAAQLLEHSAQLIALREREPAPMVLIVLRIEGLSSTARRLGEEAAHSLRRKVAVRLRMGLRASDVVAAIGPDAFGVLLSHLDSASDGETVVAKLVHALQQPFQVAGQPCAIAVATGMARYPEHGRDAAGLLQRAAAQASSMAAMGREGFATYAERGPARAANDDAAAV